MDLARKHLVVAIGNPPNLDWEDPRVREGDLLGWEKLIDDKLVEENLSINGTKQFGNLLKTCQKR
jgi:hypothetical protein